MAGGVPSQGKYFKGGLVKCRLLWRSYGVFRAREGVESRQRMRNSFSTLTFKKVKYLDLKIKKKRKIHGRGAQAHGRSNQS